MVATQGYRSLARLVVIANESQNSLEFCSELAHCREWLGVPVIRNPSISESLRKYYVIVQLHHNRHKSRPREMGRLIGLV